MTFTLSAQQCSITVTIYVNDVEAPIYGYRACVEKADIRDTTAKRRNVIYPTICAQAKTPEAALGSLLKGSPVVNCEDDYTTCAFACDRNPVRDSDSLTWGQDFCVSLGSFRF